MSSSVLRCLNCQQPLQLDESLTEKFPEWQTLTSSELSRSNSGSSFGKLSEKKPKESTGDEASGSSDQTSLGGNLGHFTAMQGNLFDMICNDANPLEHPMCQDCTDQFLDGMDKQLKSLEEECTEYRQLLDSLKEMQPIFSDSSRFDLNVSRKELAKLQSEENALRAELARLETEEREIDKQMAKETKEADQKKKEEERLWRNYRDYSRKLLELDQDEQSVQNQLKYANEQLDRLSKTNIFNLTFHIWHSGHFGTINGFRLGRLPDEQVEWNEINAAWGQTTLLLQGLAKRLNLKFARYQPIPYGNYSFMKSLSTDIKEKELPLYCSGGYKFLGSTKFDSAMVAFLDCLTQLAQEIEQKSGGFRLPYMMLKDKILDSNKEYSVKTQFNSEERWTKAMKCLLTNLKWALAWVASLES